MDAERIQAMRRWVAAVLADDAIDLSPASSDASFRSYWRVASRDRSFIVMNAPPDKEDCRPWLEVARRLRSADLNAPEILGENLGEGFLLIGDLGSRSYLDEINPDSMANLYGDALDALLAMQRKVPTEGLPSYDEARLTRELELFPEWFLSRHLGHTPQAEDWSLIGELYGKLVASALEQPTTFVHRDFHSRNLMVVPGKNPGIIDFQDAVAGPISYDLVSLLRDCYIAWPEEQVRSMANRHRDRLVEAGLLKFGETRWKRWFDWMGLQRHLKVLGIFARLNYRDGKAGFLQDLPLVLRYTLEVAGRYPELKPFADWLGRITAGRDLTRAA